MIYSALISWAGHISRRGRLIRLHIGALRAYSSNSINIRQQGSVASWYSALYLARLFSIRVGGIDTWNSEMLDEFRKISLFVLLTTVFTPSIFARALKIPICLNINHTLAVHRLVWSLSVQPTKRNRGAHQSYL